MNADKFFEKYSIEEISQKTKISPISLRFIRNKEFEKIPRAKFFGFVKIIEKEFNVDLSELKEEYNQSAPTKEAPPEINIEKKEKKNYLLTFLAFLLLIIGGFILYTSLKQQKIAKNETNNTSDLITENYIQPEPKQENTDAQLQTSIDTNLEKNSVSNTKTVPQITQTMSKPIPKKEKKTISQYPVDIIPNKLLWFKAINIDTNKSIESLTSKEKILPKGNYYIKFGHGEVTINYANQTITPNTKKIVRILFKDGNYTFMKKPNRYEK